MSERQEAHMLLKSERETFAGASCGHRCCPHDEEVWG